MYVVMKELDRQFTLVGGLKVHNNCLYDLKNLSAEEFGTLVTALHHMRLIHPAGASEGTARTCGRLLDKMGADCGA